MHNFMLGFFKFLRSFLHFMKIVFVFCIIMLAFYWVQNLTGADWKWLGFIIPFLDVLLEIANKIYSVSFDFFGATFELKYFSAVVILILLIFGMNLLVILVDIIEGLYCSVHFICKKTEEAVMNKALKDDVTREQKKISKYMVTIHTSLKSKFAHRELNIDINEQNKLMNKFIMEKTCVAPSVFEEGFMYKFNNFDKIDEVLEVLFRVMKSDTPLNYAICIQVCGQSSAEDMRQLRKLISLKSVGKITMAADTSYRYRFNETHRYGTSQIGIFQDGDITLEVHEFQEIV